jgi:MFS family permease
MLAAYSVIAVALNATFHPSRMVLMLSVTVLIGVGGLLGPFLGRSMDRGSLRRLMLLGVFLSAAGFLALSFTQSMTQVLIVYASLIAVACTLLGPISTNALLARWFSKRRGRAMGIAALGGSLGGFVFPPLIQGLIGEFGWRPGLQILAGIVFVLLAPVIYFFAVNRPSDLGLQPDGDSAPAVASRPQAARLTTRDLVRDPTFWLIAIATGLPFASSSGLTANLVQLVIAKGISATQGAFLLSATSIGSVVGKTLFAGLADRIDLRFGLAFCLIGFAVAMLSFWYAPGYSLLVPASLLMGILIGVIAPLWGLLLARAFGAENLGLVMGVISMVKMPLTLAAAPFFGWVFDKTGSYDDALLIAAGLCLAALVSLPRIRTREQIIAEPALGQA